MRNELWKKCVAFHGHECGGLTIGFQAALYAIELLGLEADEKAAFPEMKSWFVLRKMMPVGLMPFR